MYRGDKKASDAWRLQKFQEVIEGQHREHGGHR
jgi:hypothetical protein